MKRLTVSQLTFGPDYRHAPGGTIEELLEAAGNASARILQTSPSTPPVLIHAPQLGRLVRNGYRPRDLHALARFLKPVLHIAVGPHGVVLAANRPQSENGDPLRYDAVWIRDSLWACLGLKSQSRPDDAKRVLLGLLDYLGSAPQLERMRRIITRPGLLKGPRGMEEAVHIRFDGNSPEFDDVVACGKPQPWNHKQNDALGLLLDLALRAVEEGELKADDLSSSRIAGLVFLVAYFDRIRFFEMEDAGSWEEIERTNTSSIALVTSGLEQLVGMLSSRRRTDKPFCKRLLAEALHHGLIQHFSLSRLRWLVDQGYRRILTQLEAGGESPLYPPDSPKHRGPDAALLNLIFPARLRRLGVQTKIRIAFSLQPLIGLAGIRRYTGDSYQSGNFWFSTCPMSGKARKGKTRSECDFLEREKIFIPGTEAQWFFDSWYSHAMGVLHQETHREDLLERQIYFFNRALGQVTGGSRRRPVLGADGRPVPPMSLPESYNTVIANGHQAFVPSPITPLNWSKACLSLAFASLSRS